MKEQSSNGKAEQPDVLDAAIAAAIEAVTSPDLTPGGRCAAVIKELAGMTVHSAHRERAATLAREFHRTAVVLLSTLDYEQLAAERAKFMLAIRMGGLDTAPPEKTQTEIWGYRATTLEWPGQDFDLLLRRLEPGEKIAEMTADAAKTSNGREWTRRQLRLTLKPATSRLPDHLWLEEQGFPPIRQPLHPESCRISKSGKRSQSG